MIVIPIEGYALLDAIAVGEDTNPRDYNELVGGGKFTDFSEFPKWNGWRNSHAAGRYQFEPATWHEVAGALGLKDFSPGSQDQGAWHLAQEVYKSFEGRDLLSDLRAGKLWSLTDLDQTWTSINAAIGERYRGAFSARSVLMGMLAPATPSV